eukprot:1897557-Amphidinium_carterae.2
MECGRKTKRDKQQSLKQFSQCACCQGVDSALIICGNVQLSNRILPPAEVGSCWWAHSLHGVHSLQEQTPRVNEPHGLDCLDVDLGKLPV